MKSNPTTIIHKQNHHLHSPLTMELPQVMNDCSHILNLYSSNTLMGWQRLIRNTGTEASKIICSYLDEAHPFAVKKTECLCKEWNIQVRIVYLYWKGLPSILFFFSGKYSCTHTHMLPNPLTIRAATRDCPWLFIWRWRCFTTVLLIDWHNERDSNT